MALSDSGCRLAPLTAVEKGRRVRLRRVDAGRGIEARLASMGIVPGTELEVVRGNTHGPVVVAVLGSRVMLGQGMARKMYVE